MVHLLLLATGRVLSRIPLTNLLWDHVLAALPGSNLVDIHPIQLLESTALALNHEEVDDKDSDEQAASKDVTVGKVDGASDESGEEGDEEVPGPVGGSGQSHTLGTVLGREKLSDDSPDHGSPGHGVGSNEQTGDNDHTLADVGSILRVLDVQHEVA